MIVADFPRLLNGAVVGSASASYTFEVIKGAVAAAHRLGARVVAHTTTEAVKGLIGAGVDSIEHGDALRPADLEELGSRGGAWTPTLSAVFENRDKFLR